MKKSILSTVLALVSLALFTQDRMFIHKTDKQTIGALIYNTDSIYFQNQDSLCLRLDSNLYKFGLSVIDSITFGENSNTISIKYNGSSVSVVNPLAFEGVSVAVNGADVIVSSTSETKGINYSISGNSSDGMFKIYSNKRFNLLLNGIDITNTNGPAINIQSGNASVSLLSGTTNKVTDGATYATTTEEENGAFFSVDDLTFSGNGSLTITGKGTKKHALCSNDFLEIDGGNITISSAAKDGINANNGIKITDGTLNITSTSDGIDAGAGYIDISGGSITITSTTADTKGIACDSIMKISGGTLTLNVSGNQSKGLKSSEQMYLSGGTININTSGNLVLTASGSGYDPSYSTAIKSDSTINISGASITIKSTGSAGKGISSDKNVIISSGTVNISTTGSGSTYTNTLGTKDSYNATCIGANSNISVLGGTIICSSSGSGGKGLKADGTITIGSASSSPTTTITTTGTRFSVNTSDYCHPKTIVSDGAISIENGINTINSTDDGIHSETSITISGGTNTISAISTTSGVGEGVESKKIYITGGTNTITASNDGLNATMGTTSGGTESTDASVLSISGGTTYVNGTNGDAIDGNGTFTMSGGIVFANGPASGVEESCDINGGITINGGVFVACGSSQMKSNINSSSKQAILGATSSTSLSSTTLYTLAIGSTGVVALTPKYGGKYIIFSTPSMTTNSSYTIYSGGTYTGSTTSNGLYYGGTFSNSGATSKKTGTLSSIVNTVNF